MGTEAAAMPNRVGRYEIVLPIAKGGMATVYLARASGVGGFDRYMALKLTAAHLREDPQFAAHLIEEAKLVSHLRHTNVVPVYDVGECEHGVFLVMEYVPGDTYSGIRRLAREAGTDLPQRVALRILVDALTGLHVAHEQTDDEGMPLNLVHRDFSPQNILVGTDGISRLTDFGIAKASSRSSSTGAGLIKGKLRYVAPEQARGEQLDRRCDIWAAGVIAWEALSAKKLVNLDDKNAVLIPKEDPPRVRTVAPEISPELDDAIAKALRIDREKRTQTAQQLARELSAAAKTAGLLADADEVAEHVARFAGPMLAERKALLAHARRQRRNSAPDVRALIDTGAHAPMRAQLPSLPEIPIMPLPPPDPPGSELGIEVDLSGSPADRASEGILGPAAESLTPPEESVREVYRSPVVAPPSPMRRVFDAVQTRARAVVAPPWTKKKKSMAAASGGAAFLLLLVIIVSASSGSRDETPKTATTTASMRAAGAPASPATPPGASAAAGAAAAPMDVDEDAAPMLHVTANAAIAKVALPDRVVDAVVPAPTVGVDLSEADEGKALRVVVTSVDGRTVVTTAEPGTRELEVTFGEKSAARSTAPRAAPANDKRTWPKRAPR